MLSRIADSLYWLNRYVERSDSLIRLIYVHYILLLDRSSGTEQNWRRPLQLYSSSPASIISEIENDTPQALKNLLIEDGNPNSIKSIIRKARENARGVQDHITKEVWEVVNQMYHDSNHSSLAARLQKDQAVKTVESFARHTVVFAGITDNTMSRGLGWNFMNLGKYMERCMQTIAITNKELQAMEEGDSHQDILEWRYLLLSLSGYEMHLKTYRTADHRLNVLHQVTLNENFTRSVMYSLIRIKYYLENIMTIHEDQKRELLHAIGKIQSKVRYMDLQAMGARELRLFLAEVQWELGLFGNLLGQHYFSYS